MLFEQLIRLVVGLGEFFIGLILLLVALFGIALISTSLGWLGAAIVAGVIWFVVAAKRNGRAG